MTEDGLKLTVYFGERDRAGGAFLADALAGIFTQHELRTSVVIRATSGFGAKHRLRTDRLLTLSEDLPLVSVAVDARERIEAALRDVEALRFDGPVTVERARVVTGPVETAELPAGLRGEAKLTVYIGRRERAGARSAYEAVVDLLHRNGVAGATVLLAVDGTDHGVRRRARFFDRNADVPLMVISVGDGERIPAALPALGRMLASPLLTLERAQVCKRDGRRLAAPAQPPDADPAGLPRRQALTVYASEQLRHDGRPLSAELVRRLREAGAAGATSVRGIRGYHGDHVPHGDRLWQLRRRVPVVTVVIDTPANIRRWYAIVDELTTQTGLVTSDVVPAYRAASASGPLRVAERWEG